MSKLDDLITELCPDGVEFIPLGEVCDIRSGWGFPNSEQGKTNGKYPFFKVSDMNTRSNEVEMTIANNFVDDIVAKRLGCNPAPAGTVIFPKIGAAIKTNKKRVLTQPSCYDNNIFGLIPIAKICSRFLFHLIQSLDIMQFADDSGAMPSIRKTTLERFLIPVPPIPVQQEIVRTLDNYAIKKAKLEAELESELEARKKQYEYYRNFLLTFEGREESIRWMTLGDLGKVSMCKRIFKEQTHSVGDIPFYKIGTFGKEPDAYISQNLYDEYKRKYSYPKKGDILLSAAGTIGRAVIFDGTPSYFQDSNIVWITNDETIVLNKYLHYFYRVAKWAVSEGGTITRLYNDNIKKTLIPVPQIEEQERIVAILNSFDVIYNNITESLSAEIASRRKQYEYYRDKLLTFKEKVS